MSFRENRLLAILMGLDHKDEGAFLPENFEVIALKCFQRTTLPVLYRLDDALRHTITQREVQNAAKT